MGAAEIQSQWEVQSEQPAAAVSQQAQATFANHGNFFKPVFPPPPLHNPNGRPAPSNLSAPQQAQQASWDERRNKLLNDGQNIWTSRASNPPNLFTAAPLPPGAATGIFAQGGAAPYAASFNKVDMERATASQLRDLSKAPMGNFPQGPGAPPPQLFCCGLFTPLKLLLSVLVTAVALAALYVHLVNPGALSGEALKKAFVASPPPQPGAPPSPPSPPHEPPGVQTEGMFKDPDVAAFVDAGASVSVKLPEAVPAVSPVDTMFQGTDLTKPKLSIEIPTEVLNLQAQRKELAARKFSLMVEPPPMSAADRKNKKVRKRMDKAKVATKRQVQRFDKEEQSLVVKQTKMLQSAQVAALHQWEMALKADPRSFSSLPDAAAGLPAPPSYAAEYGSMRNAVDGASKEPEAVDKAMQAMLDSMAASGA